MGLCIKNRRRLKQAPRLATIQLLKPMWKTGAQREANFLDCDLRS